MNPEELENRLERSWKTIYQKAYMIGLRRSDRNGSIDK